ncbi:MAG: hypothetical protein M1830_007493 [Pleopsidium flavum]|nr:MAG: hypothetical protein M1830_007493 [Pleopsidium flavum]
MVEKRKLSTRARGDPPRKQASTPPQEPSFLEPLDEGLPTKLQDGKPLPALHEQQLKNLSAREYQNIAESGVLAASLERSRQRWINEGIFDKYWTKPSKKKNQGDIQNPPKDTMVKLGSCTITIEPHAFEATLYTVKEPQVTFLPPMALPPQRPFPQYGPPAGRIGQPPPLYNNSNPSPQPQVQVQSPKFAAPSTSTFAKEGAVQQRLAANSQPAPISTTGTPAPAQGPLGPTNSMPSPSPQQASKSSPDPVIQMLATKAATDHNLKALMRVVASGKASPAELRVFQDHIDELNGILQARSHASRPLAPSPSTASPLHRGTSSSDTFFAPHGQQILGASNLHGSTPASSSASIKTEPSSQYYSEAPPPARSKGPPPTKPDINAVVFEFTSGTGDRFLLPKYCVLEYLPGGTRVIASFLVVRKGNASGSQTHDPKLDYYEPVTMHFSSPHARILEPLVRVVAPLDEVRRYMDEIMDTTGRAKSVHLVLQLPRAPDDIMADEEEDVEGIIVDRLKAIYAPPSAIVPLRKHLKWETAGFNAK